MSKKILITGGAGFIGSHLTQFFADHQHDVTVLDNVWAGNKLTECTRSKIHFIEGDVRNYDLVHQAAEGCDVIIHLAALVGVDEVIKRKVETIEIEALGTQHVGRAAVAHKVQKVIYASSSAVYKNTINEMSHEEDELFLVNDYAIAKRLNEQYFSALSKENGISTNSLRFFNVYGCRQDDRMVMPRFIKSALDGSPLTVFGKGDQTRDFTFVNDVIHSIQLLSNRTDITGVFNVARGEETSVMELAKTVIEIAKSNSQIESLTFPEKRNAFKVNKRVGNPNRLFETIGYKPHTTLAAGLKAYINNYKKTLVKA